MDVITTRAALDRFVRSGSAPVLAPTMGALHAGHASLIGAGAAIGRARGAPCLVTIFVNPTQFENAPDFDRYPRPLDADLAVCERAGAAAVFAPPVEEVYPAGEPAQTPPLPSAATDPGLEDAARPGHFAGVCQVVLRLFRLARPCAAVFGEKDWQQLQVIRQMTLALGLGIEIVPHPTVRDPDGLAMSSRNVFLDARLRAAALSLSRALRLARDATSPAGAERAMRDEMERAGVRVGYAAVRLADSLLEPPEGAAGARRALVAGVVGNVRLIDNAPWPA